MGLQEISHSFVIMSIKGKLDQLVTVGSVKWKFYFHQSSLRDLGTTAAKMQHMFIVAKSLVPSLCAYPIFPYKKYCLLSPLSFPLYSLSEAAFACSIPPNKLLMWISCMLWLCGICHINYSSDASSTIILQSNSLLGKHWYH